MDSKQLTFASTAWLGLLFCSGVAAGQQGDLKDPRPRSDIGGAAGTILNQILRQDIGTGYTVSSLNQQALRNSQANIPNVGQQSTRPGVPGIGTALDLTPPGGGKPFESYSPPPTTSPYLNLFREDFDGSSDFNYNTLVRPMLQQQQFNQQIQRQGSDLSRRLQAMASQGAFNPQGSQELIPTGHRTTYRYFSHFYPSPRRSR
jgi:hypothetical protein